MAFALRSLVDVIEELGQPVTDIVLVEGGGRSALWRRILADVLRARIHRNAAPAATLLGGVALAGVGIGAFPNLSVVTGWQETISTDEPDARRAAHYAALHALYGRFYDRTKELFPELVTLAQSPPP